MDILDEIDAALQEKRSKWNYTPMREKSETDAIIDELLREFSPGSSYQSRSRQSYSGKSQAVKTAEPARETYTEKRTAPVNEERQERFEYNNAVRNQKKPETHLKSTSNFYVPPAEDDDEEFNQYVAEKYSSAGYDDDGYDDSDEYYDEYEEDYDEDYPEESGNGKSGGDFESFMESENDGERGDLPNYSVSGIIKTILKILVLAVFGAFAVVGIINTASIGYNKFSKEANPVSESDSLKKELQSVIYPLIVTETKDFADVSELTDEEFVNIGIWELVINGDKSVFKDKETDEYLLPQEQMTYIVEKLFGEEVKFSHTSSGIGDTAITYDKKNKQYIIPEDTDLYTYYPVVTDIAEAGDTYTVYADCYTSSPSWNSGKSDPSKRVMITLDKTAEYYNIVSLKSIPVE